MMSTTYDILSWTRSDDTDDSNILWIEEEGSEYESFDILDEDQDDWTLPSHPTIFQSWSSSIRSSVRSALQTTWEKRKKQNQVLQRFTEESVSFFSLSSQSSSSSFWEEDSSSSSGEEDCPTPTSSNRTPRYHSWFGRSKSNSSTVVRSNANSDASNGNSQVELAPLRSAFFPSSRDDEEINVSLCASTARSSTSSSSGEIEYDFVCESESSGSGSESLCGESIFSLPPPIPLRRV